MATTYAEKPKRTEHRVFQWWLLVIGFWVGVVVAVVVIGSRPQPVNQTVNPNGQISVDAFQLTATAIIRGATATAAAPLLMPENQVIDPIPLTATALVLEATQMASP